MASYRSTMLVLCLLATAPYFWAWTTDQEMHVRTCVKVLPVWLAAYTAYSLGQDTAITGYGRLIAVGLMLSSAGDVFLELEQLGESMFLLGLISFLIAHVFYCSAFGITIGSVQPAAFVGTIGFFIYWVWIIRLLYPSVEDELKIPVVVYSIIIVAMGVTAYLRMWSDSMGAFSRFMAFFGALSFVLSDSVLAINKFVVPFDNAKLYVMITYFLGQILIGISADVGIPSKEVVRERARAEKKAAGGSSRKGRKPKSDKGD